LSGQNPLLRIGMTCAVIVVGSALIGSQLSTGTLSRAVPIIADEDDAGTREDDTHAGSGDEVVDEGSEEQTEAAKDILDESADEDSENLAEVMDEESAEEPFADEDEIAPEGQAGDPAVGESAEDESGDGEGGWIIGPSSDF